MTETAFRLKGIWWSAETFTAALREIAGLHRTLTGRRVAFHFGVTEKAVRDLQKRCPLATSIIRTVREECGKQHGAPARYREFLPWQDLPSGEMADLFNAACKERERQRETRRTKSRRQKAAVGHVMVSTRVQRHQAVQACRMASMTQAEAAAQLVISLSTVKRYWPRELPGRQGRRTGRPPLSSTEKMIRNIKALNPHSRTPALHAAQLLEAEGKRVPDALRQLVQKELQSP